MYLAGSLNHLRAILDRPNPPFTDKQLPLEMAYVDDIDFIDENKTTLQEMLPKIEEIFKEWNLIVNQGKTELNEIYISENKNERGKEAWRNNKLLGSKLCSIKDIENRIQISNVAFAKFEKIWVKGSKLKLTTKIRIYKVTVIPILLYNCETWAAPKDKIEKLESCERTHLRKILKIKYPVIITNDEQYKRTACKTLLLKILESRWKMLGRILRQPENKPAQNSLMFAVVEGSKMKPRRRRPVINLLDEIKKDIKTKGYNLDTESDILQLRELAKNEKHWNELGKN